MRRRPLLLLLVMFVCIGAALPIFLVNSVETHGSTSASVITFDVVQNPITVGVILTGNAADFGWSDVPDDGANFARTSLNGHTVIVLDRLNATYRPGLTLEWALKGVLDRGATVIFVSSAYLSDPDEIRISEQYPNIVFMMNLSTRPNVERILSALPGTVSDMHPGALSVSSDSPPASAVAAPRSAEDSSESNREGVAVVFISLAVIMITLVISLLIATRLGVRATRGDRIPAKTPRKRKHRSPASGYHTRGLALEDEVSSRLTDFSVVDDNPPVIHELSTYVMGDRHFDESFPVELASGEFLGECGLSISEPVNPYDHDKVTAFELWLFDKRAINTTSVVLASEHAAKSLSTRDKLAEKGTMHQVDVDVVITLETETLRLRARVLGMDYGFADTLPLRSFFDHIVVEIAVFEC